MDLIIKNAKIIDGTGNPFYYGDIGIAAGKIQAIGRIPPTSQARIIDAKGMAACPGFIDGHSHSDFTLLQNPRAEASILQGVTTEVVGQCGIGYYPVTELNRSAIAAMSQHYQPDVPVRWTNYAEYCETVAAQPLGINVASLIPHGALRQAVMGSANRPATNAEIEQMQILLREGLDQGAAGFSTGLEYFPGFLAERNELVALLKVVAECGKIHTSHIRNRDKMFREAVEEVIAASAAAGAPLILSHLTAKPGSRPDDWAWIMDLIERKREQGVDITADAIPYRVGPGMLYNIMPLWMFEGGVQAFVAQLRDPVVREKLQNQCNRYWLLFERKEWEKLSLSGCVEHPELLGRTFLEISALMGKPPLECIFDILADEGDGAFYVTINGVLFSEEHVVEILGHPLYGIVSDAWTSEANGVTSRYANHPACFGWVPRALGHYVREKKILRLEDAVRKMTSLPARRYRLAGRGLLREDFVADIAIFDDGSLAEEVSFKEPRKYCTQMKYVLLGGRVAVENGRSQRLAAGRVLSIP